MQKGICRTSENAACDDFSINGASFLARETTSLEIENGMPWEMYSPWNNPRVEQSGFWFVPTHLRSYAATRLISPTSSYRLFTD